jgi:hypothetical protein
MSSAFWPVMMWSAPRGVVLLSKACLQKMLQDVQLTFFPIVETMQSIVHPYSSL